MAKKTYGIIVASTGHLLAAISLNPAPQTVPTIDHFVGDTYSFRFPVKSDDNVNPPTILNVRRRDLNVVELKDPPGDLCDSPTNYYIDVAKLLPAAPAQTLRVNSSTPSVTLQHSSGTLTLSVTDPVSGDTPLWAILGSNPTPVTGTIPKGLKSASLGLVLPNGPLSSSPLKSVDYPVLALISGFGVQALVQSVTA